MTEPNSGLNTLALETKAEKRGDKYIVNGSKIWITNAQHASRMILLARTATPDSGKRPDQCLSLFYADIKTGKETGQVSVSPIDKMGGKAVDANVVAFDDFEVDAADMIGSEGDGFRHVVHGLNAERCLLSGEALGLGYAALKRGTQYAKDRVVFGRPIGANQAIQHPLAKSWVRRALVSLLDARRPNSKPASTSYYTLHRALTPSLASARTDKAPSSTVSTSEQLPMPPSTSAPKLASRPAKRPS